MKVIAGLVFLVAAVVAENGCPQDQVLDWEIEKLLPHPECNKFYKCAHGQPVEMKCPSILYYNEETSMCDWPSLVNCSGRELPRTVEVSEGLVSGQIGIGTEDIIEASPESNSTEDTPVEVETEQEIGTESTTPEPIELQENGCPVDPLIHWLVPHEDNCTLFYYCDWNTKVLRECPPTTHFNRELQVCDWPEQAGCLASFNKHLASRQVLAQNQR